MNKEHKLNLCTNNSNDDDDDDSFLNNLITSQGYSFSKTLKVAKQPNCID